MRAVSPTLILTSALFVATSLTAVPADAGYTIDLIWADTGTPTLTITTGDKSVPTAACGGGARYAGSANNRCLQWRLTASETFLAAVSTLAWNAETSGIAVDYVAEYSFGRSGGAGTTLGALHPFSVLDNTNRVEACEPQCDTAWGPFGGIGFVSELAGTYVLGSISFDLSGAALGTHEITNFLREGVDGAVDAKIQFVTPQVNGATLNVIPNPEPATAALLGLGLIGLAARGRRRH